MSIRSEYVVCRNFSLILMSAKDVEEIRTLFKSKLYAKVTIGNDRSTAQQTPTDKHHETNPIWNHEMEFNMAETDIQDPSGLQLLIELFVDRTRGDKRVSYMSKSIYELFNLGANNMREGCYTMLTLPLLNDGGESKGEITFKYIFGGLVHIKKLSSVKKCVNAGASLAVKAAVMSTTGIYLSIPICVYKNTEIVRRNRSGGISSDELIDVVLEVAQNI